MVEFKGDNITIMCCSKCNIKCKHCYIEYSGDIPCNELEELVLKLKDKYNVSLNGTELLLQPGYLKVLKLINQDRVITNGLVIHNNDKLIEEMKDSGIEWVGMSYHFDFHDMISPVKKEIVIDNIIKLKGNNINVELMATISAINYRNIENMVQEAIMLGADCIRFTNLFNEGRTNSLDNKLLLTEEQINDFFDQFYHCKEKYKDKILVRRSGTFSRDERKENSSYYCPAGDKNIAIAPNYKVYPCPFLVKEGYEIGKYENGKIYIEEMYENDNTKCMLHETLNKQKVYTKKEQ